MTVREEQQLSGWQQSLSSLSNTDDSREGQQLHQLAWLATTMAVQSEQGR
jgi:hypothetical protein